MKTTTLLTALLSSNLVLGARFTQKRRETRAANAWRFPGDLTPQNVERSMEDDSPRTSSSQPLAKIEEPELYVRNNDSSNELHNSLSQNWAGALLVGTGYTAVTGTITVPTPSGANAAVQSAGAAWVGIDGGTCSQAILQTGIDWYVTKGVVTYDAWYEWYPAYSYDFTGITLKGGDSVRMTVLTSSTTNGLAVIENLTTGQAVQQFLSVAASSALCEANAEWIIEDFQSCTAAGVCPQVPFANFGAVTFTSSLALQSGNLITPGSAGQNLQTLDLYQNSTTLTNCAVSGTTVSCKYI